MASARLHPGAAPFAAPDGGGGAATAAAAAAAFLDLSSHVEFASYHDLRLSELRATGAHGFGGPLAYPFEAGGAGPPPDAFSPLAWEGLAPGAYQSPFFGIHSGGGAPPASRFPAMTVQGKRSLSGAQPAGKSKPRRRVATVAQRRAANIRERRRMFNLNSAFDKLRKKLRDRTCKHARAYNETARWIIPSL
ncbi:hypothetical protein V5799_024587 [Amblyomma americanum]|uniref:BHLH domain-containing protein n=1 Tax=Amblyomma americanum TaxID=6943 RepID=A0AAQ4EBL6_AMBAM